MTMMRIGQVCVRMFHRLVQVLMNMWFAAWVVRSMGVLVVQIVSMAMGMCCRLVHVRMFMLFD